MPFVPPGGGGDGSTGSTTTTINNTVESRELIVTHKGTTEFVPVTAPADVTVQGIWYVIGNTGLTGAFTTHADELVRLKADASLEYRDPEPREPYWLVPAVGPDTDDDEGYVDVLVWTGTAWERFVEGLNNTASGELAHVEGEGNTASADHSHAEGEDNVASGSHSHVEGQDNTASGDYSHVEGRDNTAAAEYSHAEGQNVEVTTEGTHSHAGGQDVLVANDHAFAHGARVSTNNPHAVIFGRDGVANSARTRFAIADTRDNANLTSDELTAARADSVDLNLLFKVINSGGTREGGTVVASHFRRTDDPSAVESQDGGLLVLAQGDAATDLGRIEFPTSTWGIVDFVDDATYAGDPGEGELWFNQADIATATQFKIYLSNQEAEVFDATFRVAGTQIDFVNLTDLDNPWCAALVSVSGSGNIRTVNVTPNEGNPDVSAGLAFVNMIIHGHWEVAVDERIREIVDPDKLARYPESDRVAGGWRLQDFRLVGGDYDVIDYDETEFDANDLDAGEIMLGPLSGGTRTVKVHPHSVDENVSGNYNSLQTILEQAASAGCEITIQSTVDSTVVPLRGDMDVPVTSSNGVYVFDVNQAEAATTLPSNRDVRVDIQGPLEKRIDGINTDNFTTTEGLQEHADLQNVHQDSPRRQSFLDVGAPVGRRLYLTEAGNHPTADEIFTAPLTDLLPNIGTPAVPRFVGAAAIDLTAGGGPEATTDLSTLPGILDADRVAGIWQHGYEEDNDDHIRLAVNTTRGTPRRIVFTANGESIRDQLSALGATYTVGGETYQTYLTIGRRYRGWLRNGQNIVIALQFDGGYLQADTSNSISTGTAVTPGEYRSLGNGQWEEDHALVQADLDAHIANAGAHQDSPRRQSFLGVNAPIGQRIYLTEPINHAATEHIFDLPLGELGVDDRIIGASVIDLSGETIFGQAGPEAAGDTSEFPAVMNASRIAAIWQEAGTQTYIRVLTNINVSVDGGNEIAPTHLHFSSAQQNERAVLSQVTSAADDRVTIGSNTYFIQTTEDDAYRRWLSTLFDNDNDFRFALEYPSGYLLADGNLDTGQSFVPGEYISQGSGVWLPAATTPSVWVQEHTAAGVDTSGAAELTVQTLRITPRSTTTRINVRAHCDIVSSSATAQQASGRGIGSEVRLYRGSTLLISRSSQTSVPRNTNITMSMDVDWLDLPAADTEQTYTLRVVRTGTANPTLTVSDRHIIAHEVL